MKGEGRRTTDLAPVFCDRKRGWLRQNNVSRRDFKSLLKKAKLPPMRFHDLRHTAATLMLARGVNVQVVSRKLGHKDIVTTLKVYGHLLPSMEEQAVATMATAYARIWAA
jgi:integrase